MSYTSEYRRADRRMYAPEVSQSLGPPPPPPPEEDRDYRYTSVTSVPAPLQGKRPLNHQSRYGVEEEGRGLVGHGIGRDLNVARLEPRGRGTSMAVDRRAPPPTASVVVPSRDDLLASLARLSSSARGVRVVTAVPGGIGGDSRSTRRGGATSRTAKLALPKHAVSGEPATASSVQQWAAINRAAQNTSDLKFEFDQLNKEIRSLKLSTLKPDGAVNNRKSAEVKRLERRAVPNERSSRSVSPSGRSGRGRGQEVEELMKTPWQILEDGQRLALKVRRRK